MRKNQGLLEGDLMEGGGSKAEALLQAALPVQCTLFTVRLSSTEDL